MPPFITAFLAGLLFSASHVISLYLVLQHFTNGIIPEKYVIRNNYGKSLPLVAVVLLIVLTLAPILFRISASFESNSQVLWGCYIDYFSLGVVLIGIGLLLIYALLLLIGLTNPQNMKFNSRQELLAAFLIITFYTITISFAGVRLLILLSGELHGKGASCL